MQKLTRRGTNISMIDAIHLKVHRMAASLMEGRLCPGKSDKPKKSLVATIVIVLENGIWWVVHLLLVTIFLYAFVTEDNYIKICR